ncbi:MAG: hypothetical protein HY050_03560 [Actinobacteria bacterium]|nr:hypothetical protein [Actinomycetota bacterium]
MSTMEHHVLVMHPSDEDEITAQIASRDGRTILFVKTQRGADRLADKLASVGVAVGALHGGKSQAVRTRTLEHFKSNPTATLVATDVAARGLTSRAGVYPKFVDVRPHHAELVSITGSKEPSGIAYIAPVLEKPSFGGARRKPRPGQDQRRRRPR